MTQIHAWTTGLALVAALAPAQTLAQTGETTATQLLRVRPATLASSIDQLAGRPVQVTGARVVGMFGPRVLVLDTSVRWAGTPGYRDRILVLVERGEVTVAPSLLVGSPVTIQGVARTLLGMQVTREVPWPPELDRARLERLDIRAAVLATSVRTLDGNELTGGAAGSARGTLLMPRPR